MAKVILTWREVELWRTGTGEERSRIADSLNQLAGDLGGHGIDLVDDHGNDLSDKVYGEFSFTGEE